MRLQVTKSFFFEAARKSAGPSAPVTGCSYRVDVSATGALDPRYGWIVDFSDIKTAVAPLVRQLDHALLDAVPGLENTAPEGIRTWILDRLTPRPSWLADIRVTALSVDAFILQDLPPAPSENLPARVTFAFAAAQALDALPQGHPCRNLHGHTYRVEVAVDGLNVPAIRVRLETCLAGVFDLLNNRCLNEVPGLNPPTCERLAAWLWERLIAAGLRPELVVIQETHKNRCECRPS
ncbi:MAG TPA: 6-carboxytetrahydropterin synthase [Candidatus Hydrogenedentes bacterium]|nr:6-carboxytetrahydropterin synthase [Candidatus Hydrogenedentota bacterium]